MFLYGLGPTNAMYGFGGVPAALSMQNIEMVAKAIYAAVSSISQVVSEVDYFCLALVRTNTKV